MGFKEASRIDQLVQHWEDHCLVVRAARTLAQQIRPVHRRALSLFPFYGCFDQFRDDLPKGSLDGFPMEKYFVSGGDFQEAIRTLGPILNIPRIVWRWAHSSRRIFILDSEMQQELEWTAAPGITWRDVSWPFPCFAVSLAKPLLSETGAAFDTILVNQDDGRMTTLFLLPVNLPLCLFAPEERRWLRELLAQREEVRKVKRAQAKLKELLHKLAGAQLGQMVLQSGNLDMPVGMPVEQFPAAQRHVNGDASQILDVAKRIAINVALWQQSLPGIQRTEDRWHPVTADGNNRRRAVIEGTRVFDLSGRSTVSRSKLERLQTLAKDTAQPPENEEPKPERRPSYTLPPHFRSGYWKRRPGTGNDPDAPKIVHVSWTIVHDEQLEDGQLPEGSATVFTP